MKLQTICYLSLASSAAVLANEVVEAPKTPKNPCKITDFDLTIQGQTDCINYLSKRVNRFDNGRFTGKIRKNIGEIVRNLLSELLENADMLENFVTAGYDLAIDKTGDVIADVAQDLIEDVAGDLAENMAGDMAENLLGEQAGGLVGDLAGNLAGGDTDAESVLGGLSEGLGGFWGSDSESQTTEGDDSTVSAESAASASNESGTEDSGIAGDLPSLGGWFGR